MSWTTSEFLSVLKN